MNAENWTSNPREGETDIVLDALDETRRERTLKNIARRAAFLWKDGYACKQTMHGQFVNLFQVTSPKGDRYTVKLTTTPTADFFGDNCTCLAWSKYGECKHHLAVLWQERKKKQAQEADAATEAFIAEREALMEQAETEDGCDAYAEF